MNEILIADYPASREVKLYYKGMYAPDWTWWNELQSADNIHSLPDEKWYSMDNLGLSTAVVLFFIIDQAIDILFAGYVFHYH